LLPFFFFLGKIKMSLPDYIQRYIVNDFLMPNAADMSHCRELLLYQLELLHDNLQLQHRPFKASEFALWQRITNANKRCRVRGKNPIFIYEH
jgi:hypothetical protein